MTTKDDILEALAKLDPADDTQWTDDGGPRMDVLQKLTDDKALTRAKVNEAAPQFSRESAKTAALGHETGVAPAVADGGTVLEFDDSMEPEVNGSGEPLTEDEVKAILARRIRDAEQALIEARAATNDARHEERKAEQRVTRATLDFQRRFPPISQSEAIQQHLAAQQKRLYESVTGQGAYGRSQIDQGMERSNTRGWTRPVRSLPSVRAG